MNETYLEKHFNKNPYIGPMVAAFRRYLQQTNPKPDFPHAILANGTVIRGDLIIISEIIQISHLKHMEEAQSFKIQNWDYKVSYNEFIKGVYNLITIDKPADLLNVLPVPIEPGEKTSTWLAYFDEPKKLFTLSPGTELEEACNYSIGALRDDLAQPIITAIIINDKIHWIYGRPDTYYYEA